jgi:NADH:ubiquinone oxidoreductase subunit K
MQTTASLLETTRPLSIARLVRSRLLIGAVALGVIAVAAAWQWSWLVAIGVAPLLLTVAPCAAMCGLGLCMRRMAGRSCAANSQTPARQIEPERVESSIDHKLNHGDLI